MNMDDSLLLQIWKEVCRHLEIRESAANIALQLRETAGLIDLRLDRLTPTSLDTLFLSSDDHPRKVISLTSAHWSALSTWGEKQEIWQGRGGASHEILEPILYKQHDGWQTVGPLMVQDTLAGLLHLYWSKSPQRPIAQLSQRLLEAFSAAMANDLRLSELKKLQATAEADRHSLLSRLGRQQLREDEVVGAEQGLRVVMERVELVAGSDVPVLILGETGTGKEIISRAIHQRSNRSDGPFIRVNCGAIPPELIDSQLFGHEKGSFTGASDMHQGWFERADGGTLFLDEIGELPLAAQVRLLRVLQDHQFERVGGKKPIHIDVRIIAATHRDLSNMVKTRTFREDLWYRINVFPIMLPRLRDRLIDIPALAKHFAQRASARFGLPSVDPSPTDILALTQYSWPGNIRELGAVMDRAVILGNGRTLEIVKALGLSQQAAYSTYDSNEPTFYEVIPETPSVRIQPTFSGVILSLDEAMKQHIEQALAATRGKIEGSKGAAKLLGINPHTLRARMRKLQIDWDRFRHH
jgi:hydrogenase-4 transcriptional activator